MKSRGLQVDTEVQYTFHYKDYVVGKYLADMVVNNCVVVELKANNALCIANEVQLVNYLNASMIENGLLINFGAEKLECKRKFRQYRSTKN